MIDHDHYKLEWMHHSVGCRKHLAGLIQEEHAKKKDYETQMFISTAFTGTEN